MNMNGVVREIDRMGRITIPSEFRNSLDIDAGDMVDIMLDGGSIVIRKFDPRCVFCGTFGGVKDFEHKYICASCIKRIGEMA